MRRIGLFMVITWLNWPVHAQKPNLSEKIALTNQILQRVGAAYGFDILELPKLVIYPKNKNNHHIAHLQMISAWTQQPNNSLYRSRLIMDEELFDICAALDKKQADDGRSALAFVLSHEMAHFYHHHATFRSFADQTSGVIPEKVSYDQESQADQTGLLFAYIAGYNPEPVLDALFNALYGQAQYRLTDKLWGYPTKAERQHNTRLRASEFQTYGYLFAIGHALYCREQFAEAARCFEYIYTRYPLKEAYINFGVCRLQQLVRFRKKDPISYFALPFEIDPRNRLLRLGERGESISSSEINTWFKEAETAFERAIELDASYRAAYLNQSIRALLTNNPSLSVGILTTLVQKTGQPLPANGYLIEAIANTVADNWAKADPGFRKAESQHAYQASYNKYVAQVIRNKKVNTFQQPWKHLKPQQSAQPTIGCQSGGLLLQWVDDVPATTTWSKTYLMELSNPRPFITIESGRAGTATYFRVKLGESKQYFVWQNRTSRE